MRSMFIFSLMILFVLFLTSIDVVAAADYTTVGITDDATGGDCTTVGLWDSFTKTCILTMDLNRYIILIGSNGITLNGNGHTLTGLGPVHLKGVYLKEIFGATIKNLNIEQFDIGIYVENSDNNTLSGNTVSNNTHGIYINRYSDYNTLSDNIVSDNIWYGIHLFEQSNYNTLTGNIVSGNWQGIQLLRSSNNILTNNTASDNNLGVFIRGGSNNNILTDNTASRIHIEGSSYNILSSNTGSISTKGSSYNTIIDNTASGIQLTSYSDYNILSGNTVSGGTNTILIRDSNYNTLNNNTVSNGMYGIRFQSSDYNIITNNTISNNEYGIQLQDSNLKPSRSSHSNYNQIYSNEFIDNTVQAYVTEKSTGNIFNLDKPVGGNYWNDWTSPDDDHDGFIDLPYVFTNGQDNLPLAKVQIIQAKVDFKPDTLNRKSKGKQVTVYIEVPEYDLEDIDVKTVLLYTDIGEVEAELHPTEIGDYDDDGVEDFMVKFNRQAVIKLVEPGDEVSIWVTGKLSDSTFEGVDLIKVK